MSRNKICEVIKCEKCNILYNNRSGLWKHNKNIHGNDYKQNVDNSQHANKQFDKPLEKNKRKYILVQNVIIHSHIIKVDGVMKKHVLIKKQKKT